MFPTADSSLAVSKPRSDGDAASHLRSKELNSASFCDVAATELLFQQKARRMKTARQIGNEVKFRMTFKRGSPLVIFDISADLLFLLVQAIVVL
jgi:hypothetical protein